MRVGFIYVTLLVWMLFTVAVPADEREPTASVYENTTTKNLQDSRKTAADQTASAPSSQTQDRETHPSVVKEPEKATIDNNHVAPVNSAEAGTHIKGEGDKSPSSTAPRDRRWIIRDPPPDSKTVKKAPVKSVKWKNSTQKERCENYLKELGGAFLKTRYYSIQGDSCACAEHADRFLSLQEKISQACPDKYLEYEGYSSRISRNMGWLKALGEKRCLGPNAVPGGQPGLKANQSPDTPPGSTKERMDPPPQTTGIHSKPAPVTPLSE